MKNAEVMHDVGSGNSYRKGCSVRDFYRGNEAIVLGIKGTDKGMTDVCGEIVGVGGEGCRHSRAGTEPCQRTAPLPPHCHSDVYLDSAHSVHSGPFHIKQ